jgi:hypothetical protein
LEDLGVAEMILGWILRKYDFVDWIFMALHRALVNVVSNLWVSKNAGDFLTMEFENKVLGGGCMDLLQRKKQQHSENYIITSFLICTLQRNNATKRTCRMQRTVRNLCISIERPERKRRL